MDKARERAKEKENEKEREIYQQRAKVKGFQQEMLENLKKNAKYWSMVLYVIIVIYVFIYANKNPKTLYSMRYVYLMVILIPLFIMIFLYFNATQFITTSNIRIVSIACAVLLVLYLITYYLIPSGFGKKVIAKYGMNILLAIICLVGLAILFNIFRGTTRKLTGWSGFMFQVFFFLPCLISDYFDYIRAEVAGTPPTVFILFILEIVLILAYIYIPKLLNQQITKNSRIIQMDPLRIDKVKVLDNNSMFLLKPKEIIETTTLGQDKTTVLADHTNIISTIVDASGNLLNTGANDVFTTNFGLSMWIFVNERDVGINNPNSEKEQYEIPIFKYGNLNESTGKPSISYLGNSRWKFNFTVPLNKPKKIEYQDTYFIVSVPSQKWNQVVFNYYDHQVDLWINGNLERNMDIKQNPLRQTQTDVITIGSDFGLMGAICNIQFYSKPMTLSQISQSYNVLFSQNPPVNNLS